MIFIIGIILLLVSLACVEVFIGVWTYRDAKVRSNRPVLWTVCAVLVPDCLGLVMYLLVGRTLPRPVPKPRNGFFKGAIAGGVGVVLAIAIMGASALTDAGGLAAFGGVDVGVTQNNIGSEWQMSFHTSSGTHTRTVNMSAQDLEDFTAQGTCASGNVYLYIIQGGQCTTVDLTNRTAAPVDLSAYTPGAVVLMQTNTNAQDASFNLRW
jgi:hypothetical protein